jgi:hypothetical protein
MTSADHELYAQVLRGEADMLGVGGGDAVFVRPRPGAQTLAPAVWRAHRPVAPCAGG